MNEGALPQHLLNLLIQLYRLRRITHMMHRNHLTARGCLERRTGEGKTGARRIHIRCSCRGESRRMLMLTAGLHGHLHQALQGARRSAGTLHIRQLALGDRANRLDLEHLPHHRQRRGNTTAAAQGIQGRDIEVERGLLTDGLNVVHQLRRSGVFNTRAGGCSVQHLQGTHHRMTVGARDRAAIHNAHALGTQAAQAGTGACRLHRARKLTGQVHRHHMRKTSRRQIVVDIGKHTRRGPGSAHRLTHHVREHNRLVHLGGGQILQLTIRLTGRANSHRHRNHHKITASAQALHELRVEGGGAIGYHCNAVLCVVFSLHIPTLLPVRHFRFVNA